MSKHPEAIARDKWLADHPDSTDPKTLGAQESARQYLENRLVKAFLDGIKAGRHLEREGILERIKTALLP